MGNDGENEVLTEPWRLMLAEGLSHYRKILLPTPTLMALVVGGGIGP